MSGRATQAVSAHFSDCIFMTHGPNSPAGQENFSKQLLWVFRALCKICACFSADFYAQMGLSLVSVYCLFFLPQLAVALYVSTSHNLVDLRTGTGRTCVFPEFICRNRISIEGIQWEVGTGKELDYSCGIFMQGISNCIKAVLRGFLLSTLWWCREEALSVITLILDFSLSRMGMHIFLLFMNLLVQSILLQLPEETKMGQP